MNGTFETYVFNVGHGDNILLKFSNETGVTWGVIDFHYIDGQTEPPSLTYLKSLEDEVIVIDFVHITHYHHDHTKGLDKFLRWVDQKGDKVRLGKIWLPGMPPTQKMRQIIHKLTSNKAIIAEAIKNKTRYKVEGYKYHYTLLDKKIDAYAKENCLIHLVSIGTFPVNKDYTAFCMSPSLDVVQEIWRNFSNYIEKFVDCIKANIPYVDQNTLSTILVFLRRNEHAKFAFGGDATRHDWHLALDKYDLARNDFANDLQLHSIYSSFIKASHHGSKHSSSERIWAACRAVNA